MSRENRGSACRGCAGDISDAAVSLASPDAPAATAAPPRPMLACEDELQAVLKRQITMGAVISKCRQNELMQDSVPGQWSSGADISWMAQLKDICSGRKQFDLDVAWQGQSITSASNEQLWSEREGAPERSGQAPLHGV